MFGVGFGEILIVLLIAIVFIRPEDLPKFLRGAGRLYGQIKRIYNEVMQTKDKIIKEIDKAASLDEPEGNHGPKDPAKASHENQPDAPSTKLDDSEEGANT